MFITKESGKTPPWAFCEKGEIMYQSGRLELAAVTDCPESQCFVCAHLFFSASPHILVVVHWLHYSVPIFTPRSKLLGKCHLSRRGCEEREQRELPWPYPDSPMSSRTRGRSGSFEQCWVQQSWDSIQTTWSNSTSCIPFCNFDKELTLLPCLFFTSQ